MLALYHNTGHLAFGPCYPEKSFPGFTEPYDAFLEQFPFEKERQSQVAGVRPIDGHRQPWRHKGAVPQRHLGELLSIWTR